MPQSRHSNRPARGVIALRVAWIVVSMCIEETLVCGLAVMPVAFVWLLLLDWLPLSMGPRVALASLLLLPSYVAFALFLLAFSALATRLLGRHTPAHAEMRIADLSWPVLQWARHMVHLHLVRVLAGTLFRGSPIWTAYLRLNGARIGRRVYVNTTFVSDHNLLEFDDDVVIGAEVHLSGHTVEGGIVKTAPVRLGRHVTIGLGSVIEIGVEIGDHCQVGALSFVPKHAKLTGGLVYGGIPVRRLNDD